VEKIWLKQYDEGVPATINRDDLKTLVDLFDYAVNHFAHRPAFHSMGKEMSFAEFDRLSKSFAAYLQKDLHLKRGDRVAIMMPNLLQYPIALGGCLRAGLTIVSVNPLYTARELGQLLKDSKPTTIVILENFCKTLQAALPGTTIKNVIVTAIGDMLKFPKSAIVNSAVRHLKKMVPAWDIPGTIRFNGTLSSRTPGEFKEVPVDGDDIAFLQYTGGTTGQPKGAMLTHATVSATVLQIDAWFSTRVRVGQERAIVALPLYHVAAMVCQCLANLKFGACSVLIANPKDISGFIKELKRHKFTLFGGVNTLYNALLNDPKINSVDFKSLRFSFSGAMATQKIVADRWKLLTACTLIEGYGLTETSSIVSINPLYCEDCKGSIGLPLPSVDVEIRDDDGTPVGINTPGELWVQGPQVMRGYLDRPEETEKVLDARGFVATGDIATIDELGFMRIVDRKKDMIIVSGFNVFPNEIEDIVSSHPGVMEVAAVGAPDQKSGEKVVLFVVKRDATLSQEELIDFVRQSLTSYKVPKEVIFTNELPKSNVGKILRRELREKLSQNDGNRNTSVALA
jgi:long-chain acyl-CoA synthetase